MIREYSQGSLLACNFNKLWCAALNIVHRGERLDYFAMLHDDIGAEDGWLDKLIEDMWETMYASNGVGLAAPQINKEIRLFVIDSAQIFNNMDEKEKESLCTNLLFGDHYLRKTVFLFNKMLPGYIAFVQTF